MASSITYTTDDTMRIRGVDVTDIARHATFEEMSYLLWFGTLPRMYEQKRFVKQLVENREISKRMMDHLNGIPRHTHLIDSLRSAISLLGHYDPDSIDNSVSANQRKSVRLIEQIPTIASTLYRINSNKEMTDPKASGNSAGNILHMIGMESDEEKIRLLDSVMAITSDNGMNQSTLALRHAIAAGTDLHSAVCAAICASKGDREFGAIASVRKMIHTIGDARHANLEIKTRLKNKERIPGFGICRGKQDPRTELLKEIAYKHVKKTDFETACAIEKIMEQDTGLRPNVTYYLGLIHDALGIPIEMSAPLLVMAAVPGWCAHAIEESSGKGIEMPKQQYSGMITQEWVPIQKRR